MNKNLFLTLSAFLFLFPLSGEATIAYVPNLQSPVSFSFPEAARQVYDFNLGVALLKRPKYIRGSETVNFDDRSWKLSPTPHTCFSKRLLRPVGCWNYQGPVWHRSISPVVPLREGQRYPSILKLPWGNKFFIKSAKTYSGAYRPLFLPFTLDLTTYRETIFFFLSDEMQVLRLTRHIHVPILLSPLNVSKPFQRLTNTS